MTKLQNAKSTDIIKPYKCFEETNCAAEQKRNKQQIAATDATNSF